MKDRLWVYYDVSDRITSTKTTELILTSIRRKFRGTQTMTQCITRVL